MRITEERIRSGFFWLPSEPEIKIPGTLKITDGGKIELEIVGNFGKDLNISRIVGHIEEDGYVTLDNCFYGNKKMSFGGISKSLVHVHKVLCGAHFGENEGLTFNTFSFSVEGLDEWLNISGIKVENDWSNKTASINYIPPEEEAFSLGNGMQLKFSFKWTLPGSPIITEAKITQKAYIKLISEHPKSLSDFMDLSHKIINLLCFAMDETVSIRDVSATSGKLQKEVAEGEFIPVPVILFYQSLPFSPMMPKIARYDMLFVFSAIRENASEIFKKWLDAYEALEPSLNLYFASKTGAHKYLEGKFLSLVQGLETYHRRTSNERLMSKDEYENLKLNILAHCPDENRSWLDGRLTNGNEINLSKRLKRIIEPFKEHIGNSDERGKIIRSIVDARNYFTHYDGELANKVAPPQALLSLCLKMEAIFQLHFLKMLGFTDEQINLAVRNCRSLKWKLDYPQSPDDSVNSTEGTA